MRMNKQVTDYPCSSVKPGDAFIVNWDGVSGNMLVYVLNLSNGYVTYWACEFSKFFKAPAAHASFRALTGKVFENETTEKAQDRNDSLASRAARDIGL